MFGWLFRKAERAIFTRREPPTDEALADALGLSRVEVCPSDAVSVLLSQSRMREAQARDRGDCRAIGAERRLRQKLTTKALKGEA